MTEAKPFKRDKYIAGMIYSDDLVLERAVQGLEKILGPAEDRSPRFDFDLTDYYAAEMGGAPLSRFFLSFSGLRPPEELSTIKLKTNALEEKIRLALGLSHRPVNIDPGYLTASALIMATAKDFSHRIPLRDGIYAHLELMFTKHSVRCLEWTYPDFRQPDYHDFFLRVRKSYLSQLKEVKK
ncbi:MAG: DUF4416 family protein [Candidatus Aminicenantales bacterium]